MFHNQAKEASSLPAGVPLRGRGDGRAAELPGLRPAHGQLLQLRHPRRQGHGGRQRARRSAPHRPPWRPAFEVFDSVPVLVAMEVYIDLTKDVRRGGAEPSVLGPGAPLHHGADPGQRSLASRL